MNPKPSYKFRQEQWVPHPRSEVFAFFQQPENLGRLTPPWLHFEILSASPVPMAEGTLIEYRLKVRGIPFRWSSIISDYRPPHHFVDRQVKGPYRQWIHTHSFTERDGGTLIEDEVIYGLPFGILGRWAHGIWVKPDLERIFAYRRDQISQVFSRRE